MRTGLVIRTKENQRRVIFQAQRILRSTQLGCQKTDQLFYFSSEAENWGMTATVREALYLEQLLEGFDIQQKHLTTVGEENRSFINCARTPSCKRAANTLRQNFTSFGTRRKMRLFHFITFLLTRWQPKSS